MTLLSVSGLSKAFRSPKRGRGDRVLAVDDVSFDVDEGTTVALVGESGAGKSTTAYMVMRLLEPDAGSIMLDGTDLLSLRGEPLRRFRRHFQLVFQDPHSSLDPRVPVGKSIAEPLRVLIGMNRSDGEREVRRLLQRVSLDDSLAQRYPHEMSGGQLQRVAIARALSVSPRLIVCDEAVSALDVSVRAQILGLLREIQVEEGIAYLFVAHDLSVVRAFADHTVVMRGGKVVEQGPSQELFTSPKDSYTTALLAAVPNIDPRKRRDPRWTGDGR